MMYYIYDYEWPGTEMIAGDGLTAFTPEGACGKLETLVAPSLTSTDMAQLARVCKDTLCDLRFRHLQEQGPPVWAPILELSQLRRLNLCAIHGEHEPFDISILQGILDRCSLLRMLYLSNNNLGLAGAECLAEHARLEQLNLLSVQNTNIDYAAARILGKSPHRRRTCDIYLDHNPLTAEEVRRLKDEFTQTFGRFGAMDIPRSEFVPR